MSIYGNPVMMGGSGGGGNIVIDYMDFATFNGSGYVALPYSVNEDYDIAVEFDIDAYVNAMAVIGNSVSVNYTQLIQYSNRWYTSQGTSETNFSGALTGRHIYQTNHNGGNYFDGTLVTPYTPTTNNNAFLWIGNRPAGATLFNGKILHYKITSISTGSTIVDIVPVSTSGDIETIGLFDIVSKRIYTGGVVGVGNY